MIESNNVCYIAKYVKVLHCKAGHGFEIGELLYVIDKSEDEECWLCRNAKGLEWYLTEEEFIVVNISEDEFLNNSINSDRFSIFKSRTPDFIYHYSIVDDIEERLVLEINISNGEEYCDEMANKIVGLLNSNQ